MTSPSPSCRRGIEYNESESLDELFPEELKDSYRRGIEYKESESLDELFPEELKDSYRRGIEYNESEGFPFGRVSNPPPTGGARGGH